jgi:maltose-binding protein MalE
VNSTGGTNQGEYCSQGNNLTLQDCSKLNSKYLPLARNAQQAMRYAQSNAIYVNELISAFLNMVKYTNPQTSLQSFSPVWQCVNGAAVCLGDILFTGCGQNTITC